MSSDILPAVQSDMCCDARSGFGPDMCSDMYSDMCSAIECLSGVHSGILYILSIDIL